MTELVLIRGLPGTGKTTLARTYTGYAHFEADQFFQHGDRYTFDPGLLDEAHRVCFDNTRQALAEGRNVVVANTFCRRREIERYIALGYPTRVVEARGRFPSVHGVCVEVLTRLAAEWESWPAPGGAPRAIEAGDDAIAMWESLVGSDAAVAGVGVFEYAPLPPLQSRVALARADALAVERARCASLRCDLPFWDAVMQQSLAPGSISDDLLAAAALANPDAIVPESVGREEVLDGRLRGRAQVVAADRVLAMVSDVQLRSGAGAHFPMLDFRCPVGASSESIVVRIGRRLLKAGGIVLRSGKSYHLVGRVPVSPEALRWFLAQSLFYSPLVDRVYVAHHLLRGRCTLRVSAVLGHASGPTVVCQL